MPLISKSQIEALIAREPEAVVRGLLRARQTGELIINSASQGEVRAGVVTLRDIGDKVAMFPLQKPLEQVVR